MKSVDLNKAAYVSDSLSLYDCNKSTETLYWPVRYMVENPRFLNPKSGRMCDARGDRVMLPLLGSACDLEFQLCLLTSSVV